MILAKERAFHRTEFMMLRDAASPPSSISKDGFTKQQARDTAIRTTKSIAKTCLCDNGEACQSLTAAFSLLNDPRRKFVSVPCNRESREEYLKPLLSTPEATSSSDYIAAHHFDPNIVLHHHNALSESGNKSSTIVLPRTISEEEAIRLGVDLQGKKHYAVLPNYPLEKAKADMTFMFASNSKSNKQCLCGNAGNRCQALTATFRMLHDPRRGFVRIPRYHYKNGSNHVRNAYLRHLLPYHHITKETPTKYVAAHHFDASIVLAHEECIGRPDEKPRVVPRTLTKEQVMQMSVNVDTCETMEDQKLGRVYIVAPCYPIEKAEEDVTSLLNHIYQEGTEDDDPLIEEPYLAVTPRVSNEVNNLVDTALGSRGGSIVETNTSILHLTNGLNGVPGDEGWADSLVVALTKADGGVENDLPPSYHEHIASIKALYEGTSTNDNLLCTEASETSPFNDRIPSEASKVDAIDTDECDHKDTNESLIRASTLTERVKTEEPKAVDEVDVPLPLHGGGMVERKEPLNDNCQEKADLIATEDQHSTELPVVISSLESEQVLKSLDKNDSFATIASEARERTTPNKLVDANEHSSSLQKVNFGNISIREYPIIPGDNPGGKRGPPLTIDWKPQREMSVKLDSYEASRPPRRTQMEFDMPPDVRLRLLQDSGHTLVEIQKFTKKANIARNRRKSTNGLSHFFVFSEAREQLTRSLSNLTFRKRQKQMEREFLRRSLQMDQRYPKEQSGHTEMPSFEEEHRKSPS